MMPQEQQLGVDAGNDVLHGIVVDVDATGDGAVTLLPEVFLPFAGLCDDDV